MFNKGAIMLRRQVRLKDNSRSMNFGFEIILLGRSSFVSLS